MISSASFFTVPTFSMKWNKTLLQQFFLECHYRIKNALFQALLFLLHKWDVCLPIPLLIVLLHLHFEMKTNNYLPQKNIPWLYRFGKKDPVFRAMLLSSSFTTGRSIISCAWLFLSFYFQKEISLLFTIFPWVSFSAQLLGFASAYKFFCLYSFVLSFPEKKSSLNHISSCIIV